MKRYYCDVCNNDVTEIANRNKIKITECWEGSTYRKLLCDACLNKVFEVLKGYINEETSKGKDAKTAEE